ncbi:MAG: A24 family peptidase [Burkholderiaceae bacterium]|nr:A24 family peptidase [Burkholderiaceae bacterium]
MIASLQDSAPLAVAVAAFLGLLLGSFLNVVIHRVPRMLERAWAAEAAELRGEEAPAAERYNLVVPQSHCPACGHRIGALENIPVVSWLLQRGKCTACGLAIPARYPIVELSTAVLSAVAIWRFGATAEGVGAVVLTAFLIALTFIDFDTHLLPDNMTLPLLWLGLLFNLWGVFAPLPAAVVGAMAGYLGLWSIYWLFRLATGKEGMGYGDFKLLAALGAWFGWTALPAVILLASVVGAAVGIALIIGAGRGREVPIPFGPYLAGAGLLALYFREPLGSLFGIG